VEVVASFSQGRIAAAQCVLFTHKLVPVIFEPPFTSISQLYSSATLRLCSLSYCLWF